MNDTIVAISGPVVEDSHGDLAWHSKDGMSWAQAMLPGETPQVTDVAVRPDGSMAIAVG